MNTRFYKLGAAVALLAIATGCASKTPHWDRTFGNSVRASMASQVIDPAAVRNANPVAGLDGDAAEAAHGRYVQGFRVPVAPEAAMISGSGK